MSVSMDRVVDMVDTIRFSASLLKEALHRDFGTDTDKVKEMRRSIVHLENYIEEAVRYLDGYLTHIIESSYFDGGGVMNEALCGLKVDAGKSNDKWVASDRFREAVNPCAHCEAVRAGTDGDSIYAFDRETDVV